jgi:hypothetical protein
MRYRAFFSYARADDKVANWLHRQLDGYRTPKALVGTEGELGPVPAKLHPIFRDRTDLESGGHVDAALQQALEESETLIVLCTPTSAKSHWVNHEVETFLKLGREAAMFPVIAGGVPDSGDPDTECFPPALRNKGLLAADLRDIKLPTGQLVGDGREGGRLKLIAGLLGVKLDALVQRERRRQRQVVAALGAAALTFAGVAVAAGSFWWLSAQRANTIQTQSLDIVEKSRAIVRERDRAVKNEHDRAIQQKRAEDEALRAVTAEGVAKEQRDKAIQTISDLLLERANAAFNRDDSDAAMRFALASWRMDIGHSGGQRETFSRRLIEAGQGKRIRWVEEPQARRQRYAEFVRKNAELRAVAVRECNEERARALPKTKAKHETSDEEAPPEPAFICDELMGAPDPGLSLFGAFHECGILSNDGSRIYVTSRTPFHHGRDDETFELIDIDPASPKFQTRLANVPVVDDDDAGCVPVDDQLERFVGIRRNSEASFYEDQLGVWHASSGKFEAFSLRPNGFQFYFDQAGKQFMGWWNIFNPNEFDEDPSLHLWNARTHTKLPLPEFRRILKYRPDGTPIALVSSANDVLTLVDLTSGAHRKLHGAVESSRASIVISPDAQYVALRYPNSVRVLKLEGDGRESTTADSVDIMEEDVLFTRFSPTSSSILTMDSGDVARLWGLDSAISPRSPSPIANLGVVLPNPGPVFSANGSLLASTVGGGDVIRIWDVDRQSNHIGRALFNLRIPKTDPWRAKILGYGFGRGYLVVWTSIAIITWPLEMPKTSTSQLAERICRALREGQVETRFSEVELNDALVRNGYFSSHENPSDLCAGVG